MKKEKKIKINLIFSLLVDLVGIKMKKNAPNNTAA